MTSPHDPINNIFGLGAVATGPNGDPGVDSPVAAVQRLFVAGQAVLEGTAPPQQRMTGVPEIDRFEGALSRRETLRLQLQAVEIEIAGARRALVARALPPVSPKMSVGGAAGTRSDDGAYNGNPWRGDEPSVVTTVTDERGHFEAFRSTPTSR